MSTMQLYVAGMNWNGTYSKIKAYSFISNWQ